MYVTSKDSIFYIFERKRKIICAISDSNFFHYIKESAS